jgi:hypothetical protein
MSLECHSHVKLSDRIIAVFQESMECFIQDEPSQHLHQFELGENTSLERIVTSIEMEVHYSTPESKRSSIEWRHKDLQHQKKIPDAAVSWQDHDSYVLGFRKHDLENCQRNTSYRMKILIHIWQI